jgi:hypothetical protein
MSSNGKLPSPAALAAAAAVARASSRTPSPGASRAGSVTQAPPSVASPRGSLGSSARLAPGYVSAAEAPLTARPSGGEGRGLQELSMEQVIAEVRRSCPYSWGASLRVRLHVKLLG